MAEKLLQAAILAPVSPAEKPRVKSELHEHNVTHHPQTGSVTSKRGNVVKSNDTTTNAGAAVTIKQPADLRQLHDPRAASAGIRAAVADSERLPRSSPCPASRTTSHRTLTFVDNQVDAAPARSLKATFATTDIRLWPGQFVNVNSTSGFRSRVVVPPDNQIGQNASMYSSSRGPPSTVELRLVRIDAPSATRPCRSGLNAGSVVVEGRCGSTMERA